MNHSNVLKAIDIMKRARLHQSLYMPTYQLSEKLVETEEELNVCGSTACFAGHIGISPEWREVGGTVDCDGCPEYVDGTRGSEAIAGWLGISFELAINLIFASDFYNKPFSEVTPDNVIEKLNLILEGELT